MREETTKFAAFKELGFTSSETLEFLTPQGLSKAHHTFDIRSELIFWANDVESDSRYQQFPESLESVWTY